MEKQTTEAGENVTDKEEGGHENSEIKQESSKVEAEAVPESAEGAKGEEDSKQFMEMYEESLRSLQEGELVKGEIVQINKEFILVDIGYKSEGQIPIHEFIDSEGNLTARVGEKVDVLLERREDENGVILLSKDKAAKIKIWDDIKRVYEQDGTMSGKIISRIKGGMTVDIGLQAFLPGSQIDLKPIRDFDALIGTVHDFKILKYNKRRGNIVLSRRAILEAERASMREETLEKLENGAVVEGVVKNITDYGLFIDLGGIDGLLHITDVLGSGWPSFGNVSDGRYDHGQNIELRQGN
jgi:small subunit ribosomal protein S1